MDEKSGKSEIMSNTGKIGKLIEFVFVCLGRNARHFFKLGAWRVAKPRAYLLRFSAMKPLIGSV